MKLKNILLIIGLTCSVVIYSCSKFLEQKPNGKITTPTTAADLEKLLNNYTRLNGRGPSAGEVSADNYYLSDASWGTTSEAHRNFYLWQKYDGTNGDWANGYGAIFYANLILEGTAKIFKGNAENNKARAFKGIALFTRAYNNYALAQLFIPPYDMSSASTDLGLPLKKTTDMNEKIQRSSVKETYDWIISDLRLALKYLPLKEPVKYLPTLPAAYGLFSRVYMSMKLYNKAGLYADSCLHLYDSLMDFNQLDDLSPMPFPRFNSEVIYDVETFYPSALDRSKARVDSTLYNEYMDDDLRKSLFFINNSDGSHTFKGNYTGFNNAIMFTGLATDEIILNRAESCARAGDSSNALKYLNRLLETRWRKGSYKPFQLPVDGGILKLILKERRKELLFRGLRWMDLRRLNKERQFADTLYRYINGQEYRLLPNSTNYVLQIPEKSIKMSGLTQNP